MKLFILFALILSLNVYSATTVKLLEAQYASISDVNFEYETNPELGRAWIKAIWTVGGWNTEESMQYDERVKIPDMAYDVDSQLITALSPTKGKITCAELEYRGRGIFRRTIVRETNECKIEHKVETRTFDDGFSVYTKKYDAWYLVID